MMASNGTVKKKKRLTEKSEQINDHRPRKRTPTLLGKKKNNMGRTISSTANTNQVSSSIRVKRKSGGRTV